jgi:MYXO-CTERM domain-containing protein
MPSIPGARGRFTPGRLALVVAVSSLLVAHPAAAQTVPDAGEADTLVGQLERDYAQSLASDCSTACRALESMRHAVERLCGVEPGERCERARSKLNDAAARVRAACPSCEQTLGGAEPASAPPPPPPAAQEEAAAPGRHGGCAGCSTGAVDGQHGWAALAMAVLLLFSRRRGKASA